MYDVLGGVPGSREVYLPRYSPPVDRITDACENITLPFVEGGNKIQMFTVLLINLNGYQQSQWKAASSHLVQRLNL